MKTLLIAGLDSVVGVNLAAHFAEQYRVIGVCLTDLVSLDHCHSGLCPAQEENDILEWVESIRPDRLVLCGPAANSTWDGGHRQSPGVPSAEAAGRWAAAAREFDAAFTVISSDAVFTGPWIFHDEESSCVCNSVQARAVRRAEKICAQRCPGALIVRTNVFGWNYNNGWIENTLAALESANAGPFDFQRHATPILATDLAGILQKAWASRLDGTYHIAGAERINPNQFVRRLAEEFHLNAPTPVDGNRLLQRPTGYGCGETSLHSTRIRKALDIAVPAVNDGLQRLREQKLNGYSEMLKQTAALENAA